MQKPIPCLYYAQHITELAILPSFKLNTSFHLEKKRRREKKRRGQKVCVYPRKVGGGKTRRKKEGGAHTASSSSPPLCKGSKEGALVFSFLLLPTLPPCASAGRTTRGWLSQFLRQLAALAREQQRKGGQGGSSFPALYNNTVLSIYNGCLVESHKCSQRQACCCACGVRFFDLMTMAVVVSVVAGVHEDLDGRSETSYSSSMSCW